MIGIATSTIAMTAYNYIAIQPGPRSAGEILAGVQKMWSTMLEEKELAPALAALVSRRYVKLDPTTGLYDVLDAQRRVVIARDRSDPTGWRGWLIGRRAQTKTVPLDTTKTELN